MRARLTVLTALAAAAATALHAQQAPPPAPSAAPAPIQPSEPRPLDVYTGTNRPVAGGEAPRPQPVFAVVGAHLVSGTQAPGAGSLVLMDEADPQFSCEVAHRGPLVQLACSDGSEAQLTLGSFGCGHSRSGLNASLCYGFKPKYAARRLIAPPGQTLMIEYGHLTLRPSAG